MPVLFAGLWARWRSVRKVKEGETTNDLFGTMKAERRGQGHPSKGHAGHSDYLAPAPPRDALALDRPLPDGALKVVARGDRTGDAPGKLWPP